MLRPPSRPAEMSYQSPRDGPTIVSYAQNAEDVRLWRALGSNPSGFYVDVGAGDPVTDSVTKVFYDAGWSGLNIEPGPQYELLKASRPRDINLPLAIATQPGEREMWISSPDPGLSSFIRPPEDLLPEGFTLTRRTIQTARLDDVLAEHAGGRHVDFLKIDVEGMEREVLRSFDPEAVRPTIVVVEAISPLDHRPTHEEWESLLLDAGYVFAAFDGINRFYVEERHEQLVPALAHPVSVLDRYVTAHVSELANAVERLDGENERLREELDRRRGGLDASSGQAANLHRALEEARRERDRLQASDEQMRRDIAALYGSRTWRAGQVVAAVGAPATHLARRLTHRRRRKPRKPSAAYSTAVAKGQAWHFPKRGARASRRATELDSLLHAFGRRPFASLDAGRATRLADAIGRLSWADDASLFERRLSWEERQAVVETDAIVQLVRGVARAPSAAIGADQAVVVDARCLQHPAYRERGVGLHSEAVLRTTRARAGPNRALVLLTDPELPPLDSELSALADRVIATPYEVKDYDVVLFLELSPMTASAAAAVPFLASPTCATASVVYDFIPTEYPASYLKTTVAALTNRVRLEALRHYDLLLPISNTTAGSCRRILRSDARTLTTGVADPLHGVTPSPASESPFVLVPAGGDARKNAAVAIAAAAEYMRRGGKQLRIVVTGSLTEPQVTALKMLARTTALPHDAVDLRGNVWPSELAELYETAELVLVPSIIEGFSIPVAESILRRTPVVASDIGVHRELLGAGPWLSPARDADGFAAGIAYVLEHPESVLDRQRAALGDMADPDAVARRVGTAVDQAFAMSRPSGFATRSGATRARIAVVTPFPPHESGVADYTAVTVHELLKHVEVEIYSSAPNDSSSPLPIRPISTAPYLDGDFDAVVNVVGNSHFHFPILDLMGAYGGACISHDASMVESYGYDRGVAWLADFLSSDGHSAGDKELADLFQDLDRLPAIGYELIAAQASPLIVHSRALAARIESETGTRPVVAPFVPYNRPSEETLDEALRHRARTALGLTDSVLELATFGFVDRRTKGHELVISATGWLASWGIPVRLHVVGAARADERRELEATARDLGIADHVIWHGRVARPVLEQFLLSVDVSVQLRTSGLLSLSGGLADCLAYGVPTVTTSDLAEEADAPSYVATVAPTTSSLLLAEAIDSLRSRRPDFAGLDAERRDYLDRRSVAGYVRAVLDALELNAV
jgi:FkbM family methyltransferase